MPATAGGGDQPPPALVPATGTWFGIGIDWGADSVAGVRSRLGTNRTPAVWVQFAQFPLTPDDRTHLEGFIQQVRTVGGIGLITLEPNGGLETVTTAAANDVADLVEFVAAHDLVGNVDPVQYTIRLLVPQGSLLEPVLTGSPVEITIVGALPGASGAMKMKSWK